jgi:hypothetical protein
VVTERAEKIEPTPCPACGDTGWVCEDHADRPWNDHPNACRCGGAGMPCLVCNQPKDGGARECQKISPLISIGTKRQYTGIALVPELRKVNGPFANCTRYRWAV